MSRRGPLSIEEHRAWIARFGDWVPPTLRPSEKQVDHVIGRLATTLGRSEAGLLKDVIARGDFNDAERARVEQWARAALTIAVLSAERAGRSGTRLSDNVLFHELALRWSPTYVNARERGPGRIPSEMRRDTLQAARDDLKAVGFRLQPLFELATQGVAGWYETRMSAKGRRVVLRERPLKGEALKEARALLGLPALAGVRSHLLRADESPHAIHRRTPPRAGSRQTGLLGGHDPLVGSAVTGTKSELTTSAHRLGIQAEGAHHF